MKVRGNIYILAFGENSPFYCFCGIPLSDNGHWLIVFNCTSVCYFSFIIWICVYFSFQRLNFCAASESFQILLVYFSVWLSDGCVFFFFLIKAHRHSLYPFPYSVCDCMSDVFSCFSLSVGPVFSQSSTRLLIQSPVYQHRAQSS